MSEMAAILLNLIARRNDQVIGQGRQVEKYGWDGLTAGGEAFDGQRGQKPVPARWIRPKVELALAVYKPAEDGAQGSGGVTAVFDGGF